MLIAKSLFTDYVANYIKKANGLAYQALVSEIENKIDNTEVTKYLLHEVLEFNQKYRSAWPWKKQTIVAKAILSFGQ